MRKRLWGTLTAGLCLLWLTGALPYPLARAQNQQPRRPSSPEREEDRNRRLGGELPRPGPDGTIIERDFGAEELDRILSGQPQTPEAYRGLPGRDREPVGGPEAEVLQDWPEWRGRGRTGVWLESGILDRFPEGGLEVRWRTPIGAGFAGPAVLRGRVYVLDFVPDPDSPTLAGQERLHCLDAQTGQILWTNEWQVDYAPLQVSYATGPRATPSVDVGRVYVVGATGVLRCIATANGGLIWQKDFAREYGTSIPTWGVASAPLVDGERLIAIVGGEPDAKVMAFDKRTGREVWRSLPADSELGYGQPVILDAGGARQLIVWHPTALSSLDPATGRPFWQEPWDAPMGMTVATPVRHGEHLFVSQFYGGSLMMRLAAGRSTAEVLWRARGKSEQPDETQALHSLISTPVIQGGHVYGIDSYGHLRCLDALTGERIWETLEMTELGRWASAFIVRQGDRYFVNNDQGDLIIARFTPRGYQELDRTHLIAPTSNSAWGRRPGEPKPSDRIVNWSHPAYAGRHIFARNDEEILCASLERE